MSFSTEVIANSKNEFGNRLVTMVVTFPRYILAEFNTHRMFSRNAASSRAIKFERMVEVVEQNPFIPLAYQKHHTGMQGTEYFTDLEALSYYESCWLEARNAAVKWAKNLHGANNIYEPVTKQLCNRILETYGWVTDIVSFTEVENFFELRCPKYVHGDKVFRSRRDWMAYNFHDADRNGTKEYLIPVSEADWFAISKSGAEIHIQKIAELMWDAYNQSIPKELKAGEWHVPFGDDLAHESIHYYLKDNNLLLEGNYDQQIWETRVKIATARCAQVSYTVVGEEGKPLDYAKLIALHDRLAKSGHWSPMEHCAKAMNEEQMDTYSIQNGGDEHGNPTYERGICGNFRGFIQYRKTFANENITK